MLRDGLFLSRGCYDPGVETPGRVAVAPMGLELLVICNQEPLS